MNSRQIFDSLQISLKHRGKPIHAPLWKSGQYTIERGVRARGDFPAQTLPVIYNDLQNRALKLSSKLRRRDLSLEQWAQGIRDLCTHRTWLRLFAYNGGLDPKHRDQIEAELNRGDFKGNFEQDARLDERYLAELLDLVAQKRFGSSFEFGDFDKRVNTLISSDYGRYSENFDDELGGDFPWPEDLNLDGQ